MNMNIQFNSNMSGGSNTIRINDQADDDWSWGSGGSSMDEAIFNYPNSVSNNYQEDEEVYLEEEENYQELLIQQRNSLILNLNEFQYKHIDKYINRKNE